MKNFQNKAKIIKVSTALRNIAFAGLVLWGIMIPVTLAMAILPPIFSKELSFSLTQFLVIPIYVFVFITNLKIGSRLVKHMRTRYKANDDSAKPIFSAFSSFGGQVPAVVAAVLSGYGSH